MLVSSIAYFNVNKTIVPNSVIKDKSVNKASLNEGFGYSNDKKQSNDTSFVKSFLESFKAERNGKAVHENAVSAHVLEVEHHVMLLIGAVLYVFESLVGSHHRCFADNKAVKFIEHLTEFGEVFVNMGSVGIMLHSASLGNGEAGGQTFPF